MWIADLPEAGEYEILVYQSCIKKGAWGYTGESNYPGMKNYYTVYTSNGSEEIVIERTGDDSDEWISLGRFDLPAGESHVVLDDRGIPPFEVTKEWGKDKYAQLVVADAVKWVKVK